MDFSWRDHENMNFMVFECMKNNKNKLSLERFKGEWSVKIMVFYFRLFKIKCI